MTAKKQLTHQVIHNKNIVDKFVDNIVESYVRC